MASETPRWIESEDALRALVPLPSSKTPLKKIAALDPHCRSFLALARLACLSTRRPDGLADLSLRGGEAGFARVTSDGAILLPAPADLARRDLENVRVNPFAGSIFLIPGVDETLRVNGRARVEGDAIRLEVQEAYLHCPKAFIRSHLWDAMSWRPEDERDASGLDADGFLARSPFLFLGTGMQDGHHDVGPRGDPRGFVTRAPAAPGRRALLVPDRPGNRLVDNFRNVLANPTAALLFLLPGVARTLRVFGRARLTSDAALLASMAVKGKAPLVGLWLDVAEAQVEDAPELVRAALWNSKQQVNRRALPTLGRMVIDQIQPGNLLNPVIAKGLDVALDRDAKKGLY